MLERTQTGTQFLFVFIAGFPSDEIFDTAPTNAFIVVGDDHVIQCAIHDPTLVVSWEKDGTVLQYSEAVHKVPQSDNLLIRGSIIEDSGRYTCVAMTFDGNRVAETSADLHVLPHQDIKAGGYIIISIAFRAS